MLVRGPTWTSGSMSADPWIRAVPSIMVPVSCAIRARDGATVGRVIAPGRAEYNGGFN
jgi:hypothetical protein